MTRIQPASVSFRLGGLDAFFVAHKDTRYKIQYFAPLLRQYQKDDEAMEHFAEHLNGVLEGKVRNDEGRLVEVKLHDKPQADGSIGVAIGSTSTPKQASFTVGDRVRVCKPDSSLDGLEGVIQSIVGADRIEVKNKTGCGFFRASELQLVDQTEKPSNSIPDGWQKLDPNEFPFIVIGTGNSYFDGKLVEVLQHPHPGGKCLINLHGEKTWIDASMLYAVDRWKPMPVGQGEDPFNPENRARFRTVRFSNDKLVWLYGKKLRRIEYDNCVEHSGDDHSKTFFDFDVNRARFRYCEYYDYEEPKPVIKEHLKTEPTGQSDHSPDAKNMVPEKQYRTPTIEDLANGPIECEVSMLGELYHDKAILVHVSSKHNIPFLAVNPDTHRSNRFRHCRIEVK